MILIRDCMRDKFKRFLFFRFIGAVPISHLQGIDLDQCYLPSQEMAFEAADATVREFLVNFAIESSDFYTSR